MNLTTLEIIEHDRGDGELISNVSLAVCSILLSLSGFVVSLHRSRCKNIDCCGLLRCDRVIDDEHRLSHSSSPRVETEV